MADAADRIAILYRHGVAEEKGAKPDQERVLTGAGHRSMKRASKGLRMLVPQIDAFYSSPLVRAVQTAVWIAKRYDAVPQLKLLESLVPDHDVEPFVSFVLAQTARRTVYVGHEPHLSAALGALAGIEAPELELKKGGAAAVRLLEDGSTRLEWIVTPKLLRRAG